MALSHDFPIGTISQIFENESYSLQEILRDNRKIDFESYFIKGWVLNVLIVRNVNQDGFAEKCLELLSGNLVFVYEIHRRAGI